MTKELVQVAGNSKGAELELLVVTCVVVGGVSIAGGRGTLTGVILAVFLMTMVRPVLTFLDVGEEGEKWTKAIQGLFIVLAMVSDHFIMIFQRRHVVNIHDSAVLPQDVL